MSDMIDKLERLQKLRAEGALTDAEFAIEKARLLGTAMPEASMAAPPSPIPAPLATPAPVAAPPAPAFSPPPSFPDWTEPTATGMPWWVWLAGGIAAVGVVVGLVFLLMPPTTPVGPLGPTPKPSASASPTDPLATLSLAERLVLAETAAWPDGRHFTNSEGVEIDYDRGTLVDAPFGPVLVSKGHVVEPGHADSGHVAIFYLAAQGQGYRVVKSLPDAIQSGSLGQMSEVSISDRFSSLPIVYTDGGGTWQGVTCSWTTLTELQPKGPVELVTFLNSTSNDGSLTSDVEDSSGTIADIVKDKSFDVRFTGSRDFTAHYLRRGGKYVLQGGDDNALQGC